MWIIHNPSYTANLLALTAKGRRPVEEEDDCFTFNEKENVFHFAPKHNVAGSTLAHAGLFSWCLFVTAPVMWCVPGFSGTVWSCHKHPGPPRFTSETSFGDWHCFLCGLIGLFSPSDCGSDLLPNIPVFRLSGWGHFPLAAQQTGFRSLLVCFLFVSDTRLLCTNFWEVSSCFREFLVCSVKLSISGVSAPRVNRKSVGSQKQCCLPWETGFQRKLRLPAYLIRVVRKENRSPVNLHVIFHILASTSVHQKWCHLGWMRGEFGGEWIHVYVWLSPFIGHLKLSPHC